MASFFDSWRLIFLFLAVAAVGKAVAAGYSTPVFRPTPWKLAYATFYGDETAAETMGTAFIIYIINYVFINNVDIYFFYYLKKNE